MSKVSTRDRQLCAHSNSRNLLRVGDCGQWHLRQFGVLHGPALCPDILDLPGQHIPNTDHLAHIVSVNPAPFLSTLPVALDDLGNVFVGRKGLGFDVLDVVEAAVEDFVLNRQYQV